MDINYEYSKAITAIALGLLVVYSVITFTKPQHLYRGYLVLLMLFTGTFYGLEEKALFTIYTRGAGVLGTPLINLYLLAAFVYLQLVSVGRTSVRIKDPVKLPALVLGGYILMYFSYGMLSGLPLNNIFSTFGAINIVYMFVFYFLLNASIKTSSQVMSFMRIFLVVATLMALYGLVRLALFGGDPANYYRNIQELKTNLTYFDIMQSAIFCVAGAYVFMRMQIRKSTSKSRSILLLSVYLLNIVLSFRRTAWVGTLLVLSSITMSGKGRWRLASIIIVIVMVSLLSIVYQARFSEGGRGGQETLTSDITEGGSLSIKKGRFGELYYSVLAVGGKIVIGLGPWGTNEPRVTAFRDRDFVHSSFAHMYIKLGLVGLVLYLWLIARYLIWWLKVSKENWSNQDLKTVASAFVLGLMFELPDIVFGTPLIVFRHTQLLALFIAIPVICWRIDVYEARNEVSCV